jgi:hypothetical protein
MTLMLGSSGRGYLMIIYQEKIAPPLAPPNDEEQVALLVEALVCEDRWVDSFIARLNKTIRDMKH